MKQQFTICLRAKQKDISLKVSIDDDCQTVFRKIVEKHPQCLNKKMSALNRIRQQLQSRLKNFSVSSDLQQSITYFLNNSFNSLDQSTKRQNQTIDQSGIQPIRTSQPLKAKQFNSNKQRDSDYALQTKRDAQYLEGVQAHLSDNKAKKNQNICLRTSKGNSKKDKAKIGRFKQKTAVNVDIVKACESIIKKSTQVDMKNMARQYLRQTGFCVQNSLTTHPKRLRLSPANALVQQQAQQPQNSTTVTPQANNSHPISSNIAEQQAPLKRGEVEQKKRFNYRSNKYRYLHSSLVHSSTSNAQETLSGQQDVKDKGKKYKYLPASIEQI